MKKAIIIMMLTGLCQAGEFNPHQIMPQQQVMHALALQVAVGNNIPEIVTEPVARVERQPRQRMQKQQNYHRSKNNPTNRLNQPRPGF